MAPATPSAQVCDASRPTERAGAVDASMALVVFCNEDRPIIAAGAWGPPIATAQAPEFQELVRQAMQHLFVPEFSGGDVNLPDYPD